MIRSFNFAFDKGSLSISQRRGITLIPKPNKDTTLLDNLRPGLEITAGQRTMSELIWEVDRSTFCLTGQVDRSHLIVLKNKIN